MKLTRKQELVLIDLGLRWLLEHLPPGLAQTNSIVAVKLTEPKVRKPRKTKRKWSPEQREKFSASMKRHWEKRRKTKAQK